MPAVTEAPFGQHFDPRRGCVVTPRQRQLERLESQITELWGHINAASYRFLELVAEFDRLKGHEEHGLVHCAQWLNWQCGIGGVAAREKVRVARALEALPKISDAFRRGVISYSKVRAITRVATPEDEDVLLNTAIYGTAAHVERHVRKFRWCERRDEAQAAEERHQRRYVSCFHDEDGSVVIHAVLPPEIGALVQKALEAAVDEVDEAPAPDSEAACDDSAETAAGPAAEAHGDQTPVEMERPADGTIETQSSVSAESSASAASNGACSDAERSLGPEREIGTRSNVSAETPARCRPPAEASESTHTLPTRHAPFGTKRADALRLLAETYLERRTEARGSVADRFQVTVHIDQRLLVDRRLLAKPPTAMSRATGDGDGDSYGDDVTPAAHAGETALERDVLRYCELEDADRPLAIATARRLACDATLVGIVDDARGEALDVGHRTRAIRPAMQRALKARDGGCVFPGCGRTRFTEGHHVVHWADGGPTKLDNLVTLCRFHHRLVHEGGFGLHVLADRAARERFVFTRPDGTRVEPNGRFVLGAGPVSRADIDDLESPTEDSREPPARSSPELSAEHPPAPPAETSPELRAEDSPEPPLFELNRRRGLEIDAETSRCGWCGETMDYSTAIEAQQFCRERAQRLN